MAIPPDDLICVRALGAYCTCRECRLVRDASKVAFDEGTEALRATPGVTVTDFEVESSFDAAVRNVGAAALETPPHMDPMSADEVRELLGATLHGPLPHATVQRMMATLAAWLPEEPCTDPQQAALRVATLAEEVVAELSDGDDKSEAISLIRHAFGHGY